MIDWEPIVLGHGSGFYWVKLKLELIGGQKIAQWTICYWSSEELWWEIGEDKDVHWDRILDIGPKVECPFVPNDYEYL